MGINASDLHRALFNGSIGKAQSIDTFIEGDNLSDKVKDRIAKEVGDLSKNKDIINWATLKKHFEKE